MLLMVLKSFNQMTNKRYLDNFQYIVIVISIEINILVFISLTTYFRISTVLTVLNPIYNVEEGRCLPYPKKFFDTNQVPYNLTQF